MLVMELVSLLFIIILFEEKNNNKSNKRQKATTLHTSTRFTYFIVTGTEDLQRIKKRWEYLKRGTLWWLKGKYHIF